MTRIAPIGPGKLPQDIHIAPSSINVIAGTPTGSVADIQEWQDGNFLAVQEAAATPGINVEINFTDILSARRFGMSMYYVGSSTHWIEAQIYDFVSMSWKTVWTFSLGRGFNYRYSDMPSINGNIIDGSGNVKGRLYHPTGGNASHDLFVDYAALIT